MLNKKIMGLTAGVAAIATLGACTTDGVTGERRISTEAGIGAAVGTVLGYLAGDIIGGKNDRTAKIIGAGVGAVAGGAVGSYMDKQEQEMRRQTAGTGVEVIRDGDDLLLRMPSGITFDTNQAVVKPQFQDTLNQVAQTMVNYPSTYIDVMGHTDSTGSDSYNQQLSQRRAQAVANYLAQRGVQPQRMATVGYGESQLLYNPDNTEAEREANRRVEIKVVPVTQDDVQTYGY
ncbi:OmpA family protein [Sphingomicrobium flavum]|uniref:OmpA family protein n=1 Tax=Sphingomicrobium flavum TaxID=1229164 RepID=UPI0021ADBBBA|nr:OmpA family protein [Sphingomicrobium flavum]